MKLVAVKESPGKNNRIDTIVDELVKKMAQDLGCVGEEDLLLSDSAILSELQKRAEDALRKEEEENVKAEEARKREILLAAKNQLGLITKPPQLKAVPSKPQQSAWQKYLADKPADFLPPVFRRLESLEEVSAARGALIGIMSYNRRSANWVKPEFAKAVAIWFKRWQALVEKINDFFGKSDYPKASQKIFEAVNPLLKGSPDLEWVFDGPQGIQRELDGEEALKKATAEKKRVRRERELSRLRHHEKMVQALLEKGVPEEEAGKMTRALTKKFPFASLDEALAKMAVLRQADAIITDRRFTEEVAPEAAIYVELGNLDESRLFTEACQQPKVMISIQRSQPGFGEMKPIAKGNKKPKGKKGGKK